MISFKDQLQVGISQNDDDYFIIINSGAYEKKGKYQNGYDKPLTFQCSSSHAIKRVKSKYSKTHGDRKFLFSCASYGSSSVCSDCKTTPQFVNKKKEAISFNCPSNQVLSGVKSTHSNEGEDRRWKFRCAKHLSMSPATAN